MNLIKINDERFRVDTVRSGLRAVVASNVNDVTISLVVEADKTTLTAYDATILDFAFAPKHMKLGWRTLSRQSVNIDYHSNRNFILPDDPATVYLGWHMTTRNNKIEFGDYENGGFRIKWTCQASGFPEDAESYQISVDSWLPIVGVDVNLPELIEVAVNNADDDSPEALDNAFSGLRIDVGESLAILSHKFDPNDYGTPERLRWGLRFPYKCSE